MPDSSSADPRAAAAAARRFRRAVVALTVVAGVLRFWGLTGGLPHPMSRPDEEFILAHTAPLAAGNPDLGYAIYPNLYMYVTWAWGAAGLEVAERLGVFPPGDYATVLREHPARLLAVGRALSALAATATVPLLAALARPALGPGPALAAAGFLAVNLLHVRDAHAVKPDALLTLGVVAALACAVRLAARPTAGRALATGATIGLATGMKYPALLLLAPAWLATVLGGAGRGLRRAVPPAAVGVGVVALVTFVATSPYLFLNPTTRASVLAVFGSIFPEAFPQLAAPQLPAALRALRPEHHWWDGFVYHARFSLRYGIGLLPTLALPAALAWGTVDRRALPRLAAAWIVVWYAVNGVSPMMLARYMTPIVPAVAVLLAGAGAALARRAAGGHPGTLLFWLLAVAFAGESFAASVAHDLVLSRPDTRVLAQRWLAERLPPGARVAVVGTRFWGYGEPVLPRGTVAVRLADDPAAVRASDAEWLVVHDHPGIFSSHVSPATSAALDAVATRVAEFDPFRPGGRARAVFEFWDAYYVPIAGVLGVERPGPVVRVYRRG